MSEINPKINLRDLVGLILVMMLPGPLIPKSEIHPCKGPRWKEQETPKKVSQVISGYLTRFGKSNVHLVFLL